LLRKLCEHCREAYEPLPEIRKQFQITEELLYRAKGCDECTHTGYRGRLGIYEVMGLTRELRDLIVKGSPAQVLRDSAVQSGLTTLWQAGLKKVRGGFTSLEELESVVLLEPT